MEIGIRITSRSCFNKRLHWLLTIVFGIVAVSLNAQINAQRNSEGTLILEGDNPVVFYQKTPTGPNGHLLRNNFLHPVYFSDGTIVTENAPESHLHQRGIFWGWHQILIGSQLVGNSWLLSNFSCRVKSVKFKSLHDGSGQLFTKSYWYSPEFKNAGKPYLKENTIYLFHQEKDNYRIIDFAITFTPLVDSLKLGGSNDIKGYGGFSARIILPDDVQFFSANGHVEPRIDALDIGEYVMISGSFLNNGTEKGGMAIFADPENQKKSQTWILRSKNSMQNAVFPGRIPMMLHKGEPLQLNYRVVFFSGIIEPGDFIIR